MNVYKEEAIAEEEEMEKWEGENPDKETVAREMKKMLKGKQSIGSIYLLRSPDVDIKMKSIRFYKIKNWITHKIWSIEVIR